MKLLKYFLFHEKLHPLFYATSGSPDFANEDYSRAKGAKRRSGRKPGQGLLIPHGYLHPGKCEHSEVQSSSVIAGASLWFMGGPPH